MLEFSLAENIALHDYAEPPDSKWGWLFPKRLVARAQDLIKEFDVRGGGPFTPAGAWWMCWRMIGSVSGTFVVAFTQTSFVSLFTVMFALPV